MYSTCDVLTCCAHAIPLVKNNNKIKKNKKSKAKRENLRTDRSLLRKLYLL